MLLSSFRFLGYLILFYTCIVLVFRVLDSGKINRLPAQPRRICYVLFDSHPFLFPWAIILLCWLPYLLAFYPGCPNWDAFGQLKQIFGIWEMNHHHPLLPTALMGGCMQLGRFFGSDNLGIFFYTLLQTLAFSASLAFSIWYMTKIKTPDWLRGLSLLFFAVFPLFPGYAQWVVKDTLFVACMVIYTVFLAETLRRPVNILQRPLRLLCFFLSTILVCLLRNNGIFIILLSLPLLLLAVPTKTGKCRVLCLTLATAAVFGGYMKILLPALQIPNGSIAETLSIPFQQTARYGREHPEDITPEEQAVIQKIFNGADIYTDYNPEISDPVKNQFNKASAQEDLEAYFQVWFQQLLRHPSTYLQATLHNIYGYFYPDIEMWEYGGRGFGTVSATDTDGDFHFYNPGQLAGARKILEGWTDLWRDIPGIGAFYRIGTYTWLLAIMLAYLISRKKGRCLVLLLPGIVVILVCMASPVNRYVRYFLPVIAAMPVIIASLLHALRGNDKQKDGNGNNETAQEFPQA